MLLTAILLLTMSLERRDLKANQDNLRFMETIRVLAPQISTVLFALGNEVGKCNRFHVQLICVLHFCSYKTVLSKNFFGRIELKYASVATLSVCHVLA